MSDKRQQIIWEDSSSTSVWTYFEQVNELEPMAITSIGFILNETDDFVTMAGHISKHQADGAMCIPKACIKSRKDI